MGEDADLDAGADTDEPSLARPFPEDFRFGVATAAHQIEGGQHNTWSLFENLPQFSAFTVEPSGLATDHYHRYAEDFDLAAGLGMDVFRLSIEWSRIEPERGSYDEDEIAHYHDVFDAMAERGLQPSVTLHHFAEPPWWVDLTKVTEPYLETFCADGPSDEDFCAWTNDEAPAVFAAFCARMAAEYGDQVDEWMTFNEPQAYWVASTVTGEFPPPLGLPLTGTTSEDLARYSLPTLRNMLAAHVACYDAIHENDTVDADGDGRAAVVGLATGTGAARPAREGNEDDIAAAKQAEWVATFLFFDAIVSGELDTDFDMEPDEPHPDWAGKIDILGLQYYASTTVLGVALHPMLWGIPCMNLEGEDELLALELQLGCPPPPTNDFPLGDGDNPQVFGRQHDPEGLMEVLTLLNERYPTLPLVITENGFADYPGKRAHSIVRHLDVCHAAVELGIPLEGYYHWSITDNFEWGRGFGVRFGLYHVDFDGDLTRTATEAADVYGAIGRAHGISQALLDQYDGEGALPDEEKLADPPLEVPQFSAAPAAPASPLPAERESCALIREERCVSGTRQVCRLYDTAAGNFAADVPPMTEQAYVFDRYFDLYHQANGQSMDVDFTEPVLAGTPESEWSKPQYFEEYSGYGDSSGWTATALWAAAARYQSTGTPADYARMLDKLEAALFHYEVTSVPGLIARSHWAMLEEGAPKPRGHWGESIQGWELGDGSDGHFSFPIAEDLRDRLPDYYEGEVEIDGETYTTTPRVQTDASRDMYVRGLPGVLLAYDLLGEGEREDTLRAVAQQELPCTLNRMKKGRIANLQQNPTLLDAVTTYLNGGSLTLDDGDLDFSTLDTLIFYVLEQPHPLHTDVFDATCPDGPPMEIDPEFDLDASDPSFLFDLMALAEREQGEGEIPIAFTQHPSIRASDTLFMTQWALTGHYLTGDEAYLAFVEQLMEEIPVVPVLNTAGAFQLPKYCAPHFAPSLVYPTFYNLLKRIDREAYPVLWKALSRVAVVEGRYKEHFEREDPFWGILYAGMVDERTDPYWEAYVQHFVELLATYGMNADDKLEPDRAYPRDFVTVPDPDVPLESIEEGDPEWAVCEDSTIVLGIEVPGPGIDGIAVRAVEALPLDKRIGGTMLWQMDPFMVQRTYGGVGMHRQWPMLGMFTPYWIGRADGVITEGRDLVLAWEETGEACE